MKILDEIPYDIPDFFCSYLFNGDASGLTDKEKELFDSFYEFEFGGKLVEFDTDLDEPGFMKYHDVPGIGACNCVCVTAFFLSN